MHITEILRGKGDQVVTVRPRSSVREFVQLLADHNIGAAVVSEDGTGVLGIVSERDVVRRMHLDSRILDAAVADIMTATVRTCTPDDTVDMLMRTMTDHRVRHVPVVVDGQLVGLVSIGDVVKSRISELEFERGQLEHYIAGR